VFVVATMRFSKKSNSVIRDSLVSPRQAFFCHSQVISEIAKVPELGKCCTKFEIILIYNEYEYHQSKQYTTGRKLNSIANV